MIFCYFLGLIGSVVALVGWFGFHSQLFLIIGTALYLLETIIEWKNLNTGAKLLDLIIFGIGCIVGAFIKSVPFYVVGLIALNCWALVTALITLPATIAEIKNR